MIDKKSYTCMDNTLIDYTTALSHPVVFHSVYTESVDHKNAVQC